MDELPTSVDRAGGSPGPQSPPPAVGASLRQTVFNVANIYIGLGLLTMPFATAKGGWAALLALALLVPLFALSGQLICAAFDLMPPGSRKTFPELGRAAAGRGGMRAVFLFCSLELFGATIMLLMVAWQQLELLLPAAGLGALTPMHLAAALTTASLLPLLFIELRRLGPLSGAGVVATGLVLVMVLALRGLDPHRAAMPQQPPPGRHLFSAGVLQSVGIFALSCSAHSTLPALRSSMRKPSRFSTALSLAFGAMLFAYCGLAAAGYWYWGDSASPLVTADLANNSFYSGRAVRVDKLLALLVLVSCATKYPGLNMILQDMLVPLLPFARDAAGNFRPPLHWVTHALRVALFALGTLLALSAYRVLGSALSLLGGLCSITCSLVLPTAFYLRLSWGRLAWPRRAGLLAMLALGAALVCLVTGMNVCELLPACRERYLQPGGAAAGVTADAWAGWMAAAALPGT